MLPRRLGSSKTNPSSINVAPGTSRRSPDLGLVKRIGPFGTQALQPDLRTVLVRTSQANGLHEAVGAGPVVEVVGAG